MGEDKGTKWLVFIFSEQLDSTLNIISNLTHVMICEDR